jgi:hypothetical protein
MLNPSRLTGINSLLRTLILTLFFLVTFKSNFANELNLSYSSIPQALLQNANAVVRFHNTDFSIYSAQKASVKVNYAITIINETAQNNAVFQEFYNQFIKISNIRITMYDKDGTRVEKMDRQKLIDLSAISGFSTYEDNRVLIYIPRYKTLPYTVEFSYEINLSGILDYPDIYLFQKYNTSLEKASVTVTAPDSLGFRYLSRNVNAESKLQSWNGEQILMWETELIPAITEEPFSPPLLERIPVLMLAPNTFKIKSFNGNSESWKDFGKWFDDLSKGRDNLNAEATEKIRNLVLETDDTIKIIKTLYQYMQNKTRYASIQIGIGGWQPADANDVDRLGYGDCKALSNYMKAILKAVNIDSHITLVNAGRDKTRMVTEFPANQFNHAILCVPLKTDTFWLECTSPQYPAGFIGTFTDDREVLVITENGGHVRRTKSYSIDENLQTRKCEVKVLNEESADVSISTKYQGIFYDEMQRTMNLDDIDKKKEIEKNFKSLNYKLETFQFTDKQSPVPEIGEKIEMKLNNLINQAGEFMIFVPNQFTRQDPLARTIKKRNSDIWINHGYTQTDTVNYVLSENLVFKEISQNNSFKCIFGEYSFKTEILDNKLQYIRKFTLSKGVYPKDSYGEFVDFFNQVSKNDNVKIRVKLK